MQQPATDATSAAPTRPSSPGGLAPGIILGDRYRLDRHLGAGGMGTVWRAFDLDLKREVALKLLIDERAGEEERRRCVREARAASAVVHPHVIQVLDVLELGARPAIVMELLEGESLRDLLDRERSLPFEVASALLLPVASAVGAAHARGIIHRDLKPANVFLCKTANGGIHPKVVDFGIAKLTVHGEALDSGTLTVSGTVLGSAPYMSPEQAFGDKDIDHRTDIWSLGIVLYECLSGILPTHADNTAQVLRLVATGDFRPLRDVAPAVPESIASLVGRMLSENPGDRPASMEEVCAALQSPSARGSGLPAQPRVSVKHSAWCPGPRVRRYVLVAAGALAVIAGLVLAVRHFGRRGRRPDPSLLVPMPHHADELGPTEIRLKERPAALFAGHTIAVVHEEAGGLLGWDAAGLAGARAEPRAIGICEATSFALLGNLMFATDESGATWVWSDSQPEPVRIGGLPEIKAVVAGSTRFFFLSIEGAALEFNPLGWRMTEPGDRSTNGPPVFRIPNEPIILRADQVLSDVTAIAGAGDGFTALGRDGTRHRCGSDMLMRTCETTFPIAGMPREMAPRAAGSHHNLTLDEEGTVWASGDNTYLQLGVPDAPPRTWVVISGLPSIRAIAAGGNMSLAVDDDGGVWEWGTRYVGVNVRPRAAKESHLPHRVEGLPPVKLVATAGDYSMAATDDALWVWGLDRKAKHW